MSKKQKEVMEKNEERGSIKEAVKRKGRKKDLRWRRKIKEKFK